MGMKAPTKIFILGLFAAGIVWSAGTLNARRLVHTESALHAECESENSKRRAEAAQRADRSLLDLSDTDLAVLAKQRNASLAELIEQRAAQRAAKSIENLSIPSEWRIYHDEMICDAEELQDVKAVGLQAAIVEAHRATLGSQHWPLSVALILLCLAAVPWLWYFLLRRIAELRSAIAGKPPM
jgi:hypothetical protein